MSIPRVCRTMKTLFEQDGVELAKPSRHAKAQHDLHAIGVCVGAGVVAAPPGWA